MRVSQLLGEPEQLPIQVHGGLEDISLDRQHTALLIIDMQKGLAIPYQGAKAAGARELGLEQELEYYWNRVKMTVRNLGRMRDAFRAASMEVIYLKNGSRAADGRDRGAAHRLLHAGRGYRTRTGEIVPYPEPGGDIIDELAPAPNEIVIEKYSAGAFGNTNIDLILHNLGITTLVAGGLVTNQCVESTLRGAFDYGFIPVLVEDATGTWSAELQNGTLRSIGDWFCPVRTTDEVLAEVATFVSGASVEAAARQPVAASATANGG